MSVPDESAGRRSGIVRAPQNLAGGIFLVALAALAIWLTRDLDQGSLRSMGPAMLPDWLAYGVGLCGLALIASAFVKDGEPLERWTLRGPFFVVLAILAFAITIRQFSFGPLSLPSFGIVIAGPLAIIIGGYATPDVQFRPLVILSLSLTPFCMVLFGDLLNLPIPLFPQVVADLFPAGWSQKQILRAIAAIMVAGAVVVYFMGRNRRKSNEIDVVDHSGRI